VSAPPNPQASAADATTASTAERAGTAGAGDFGAPALVLLFSATLWGLSWWPLKHFAAAGLSGPLLALCTYGSLGLLGLPWLVASWRKSPPAAAEPISAWRSEWRWLLLLAAAGGWANAAFVHAMALGDVVRVMLLFYLSPVWAVLGGWLLLGERLSGRRAAAVGLALFGAFWVIGGGAAFNAPLSAADVLALTSGLAFAANNLVARRAQRLPMATKTIAVFLGSGLAAGLTLLASGDSLDTLASSLGGLGWSLGAGLAAYALVWTVLATATWQFGVTHVEAGRAGVILVAELVVGVVSAALFGDEHLGLREWLGAGLVTLAALLEARSSAAAPATPAFHPRPS
jgi:drug/metabolite transporter (DMT)-like permease